MSTRMERSALVSGVKFLMPARPLEILHPRKLPFVSNCQLRTTRVSTAHAYHCRSSAVHARVIGALEAQARNSTVAAAANLQPALTRGDSCSAVRADVVVGAHVAVLVQHHHEAAAAHDAGEKVPGLAATKHSAAHEFAAAHASVARH